MGCNLGVGSLCRFGRDDWLVLGKYEYTMLCLRFYDFTAFDIPSYILMDNVIMEGDF